MDRQAYVQHKENVNYMHEWLVWGSEFFMKHMFSDKEMDYVGVQYAQNNGYLHTN